MINNLIVSTLIFSFITPFSYVGRETPEPHSEVIRNDIASDDSIIMTTSTISTHIMHGKICKVAPKSPLCYSPELIDIFQKHADRQGIPIEILLGIGFSESGLGVNFNKLNREDCRAGSNNWFGLKGRHDGVRAIRDQKIGRGCWLYKFESLDKAVESMANTIGVGYKGCFKWKDPVRCLSYSYVGDPIVAEESWQRRVNIFKP